jgi:Tfp pilus assembly protein PilV
MLEVLIAILVITFFLAGTLQLMAVNTLYKLLSKQQANASLWIQEDVEEVRAMAATLTRNDALCKPTSIIDSPANNYASALRSAIQSSTALPGSTTKPLLSPNGKPYRMNRLYRNPTTTVSEPNLLKITWQVVDTEADAGTDRDINRTGNGVVATFYTEITPAASFQCP